MTRTSAFCVTEWKPPTATSPPSARPRSSPVSVRARGWPPLTFDVPSTIASPAAQSKLAPAGGPAWIAPTYVDSWFCVGEIEAASRASNRPMRARTNADASSELPPSTADASCVDVTVTPARVGPNARCALSESACEPDVTEPSPAPK